MTAVRVPLGSLAAKYHHAVRDLLGAERDIESLLSALYGPFSEWEAGPDGIDVYDAIDSTAAAMALHRAGFRSVRCHGHARRAFKTCACPIRRDLLGE